MALFIAPPVTVARSLALSCDMDPDKTPGLAMITAGQRPTQLSPEAETAYDVAVAILDGGVLAEPMYQMARLAANVRGSQSIVETLHSGRTILSFEGSLGIIPGITAIPTPGHTPGHTSYAVEHTAVEMITEVEPAGELVLKGFHQPVRAFNVRKLAIKESRSRRVARGRLD